MDVTFDRIALLAALRLARRAAGRSSTCRAPAVRLLAAAPGEAAAVSLAATDRRVALTHTVDAAVAEPGRVLLPVPLLAGVVAELPDGPVRLRRTEAAPCGGERGVVEIAAGDVRIEIDGLDPAALPDLPPAPPAATPVLDAPPLARALAFVGPALRGDEDRPGLSGVLIEIEHDRLVLSASDGFRLGRATLPYPDGGRVAERHAIIVPREALPHFRRVLGGARIARLGTGAASVAGSPLISLATERATVIGRAVAAPAQDFSAAIPQASSTRVVADLPALRRTVRLALRLGPARREEGASIVVLPSPRGLRLVARRGEGAAGLDASVAAELDGEAAPIVMDARQLWDPLRLVGGARVALEWAGANGPMVVRELAPASTPPALWAVMPLRHPQALEREARRAAAA